MGSSGGAFESRRVVPMPQLVVLAGGLGTRLGEVSERTPKSLVEVSGKPILSHILDWACHQGCSRGLVLIGHLGDHFDGFAHPGMELQFHREKSPLGTGGALWNARAFLEERFILLWGDDLHRISYDSLLETHHSSGCSLTMTVTSEHEWCNLQHNDGRLLRYDKSLQNPEGLNGYEAGTSVVERTVLETHGRGGVWSWEEVIYRELSGSIAVHLDDSPFWDIGTLEGLERLEFFMKEGGL